MRVRRHHAWGALLIALFALPVLKPEGFAALEEPVGGFFAWFSRIAPLNPHLWVSTPPVEEDLSPRARSLEQQNAELRRYIAERLVMQADLRAFRDALEESGLDRFPPVRAARVLRTADASGFRRSILIDRGARDGLRPGCAVVSGAVFLGRVEIVHSRSSLVKLVTDARSRLEVAVLASGGGRLVGYLRGTGRGASDEELLVRHLRLTPGAGRILPGASVWTSNQDRLVPAGLLVGFVTEVSDRDLDDMPAIRMRPALDLRRSTHVLVLLPP